MCFLLLSWFSSAWIRHLMNCYDGYRPVVQTKIVALHFLSEHRTSASISLFDYLWGGSAPLSLSRPHLCIGDHIPWFLWVATIVCLLSLSASVWSLSLDVFRISALNLWQLFWQFIIYIFGAGSYSKSALKFLYIASYFWFIHVVVVGPVGLCF